MTGTVNTTVKALRQARALKLLADIGKWRRGVQKGPAVTPPMAHEARVRAYAKQSGWTSDFTPAQRRRLRHKSNHAIRPLKSSGPLLLTAVDEGL